MTRQEKLEWLARNVHEWKHGATHATVDDGEADWWPLPPATPYAFTKQEWLSMREKLQNKPSWKDAPEWANWLGQTCDGDWEWYGDEEAPSVNEAFQYFDHMRDGDEAGFKGEILGDWRDTLERRPDMTSKNNDVRECQYVPPSKPQDNSWHERGELPPVGTECEFILDGEKCFIVAHHHFDASVAIWSCTKDDGELFYGEANEFRPLSTEREKAIDAAMDGINVEDGFIYSSRSIIEKLYDAGMLK